jgi:hypothetical protein
MLDIAMNLAFLRGESFTEVKKQPEPPKSKMAGVRYDKQWKRYRVKINDAYLGSYNTLEEAEAAAILYRNTLGAQQ